MTNQLIQINNKFNEKGIVTGLVIIYAVGDDRRSIFLSTAEIDGLALAEIHALAQARADADTGLPGPANEREDILPNNVKALLEIAQTEIDYLDANIPLISSLTTVPQLRVAVERLARENRAIIKALIRLAT